MEKSKVDISFILELAKLFVSGDDRVFYVCKKYLRTLLAINREYKSINSKKKPKIKPLPNIESNIGVIDNDNIEELTYYVTAIMNFIEVVEKKFSPSNLRIFYNNINTLNVTRLYSTEQYKRETGLYDFITNTIFLKKNCIDSIYHELFHMASARLLNGIAYTGFAIYGKEVIGKALNEGYTEIITKRYFGDFENLKFLRKNYGRENTMDKIGGAYPFEVLIASKIEQIVGQDQMEELYLNANLYGLVERLKKYASKEEIESFIRKTDFLSNVMDGVYEYSIRNKKIHQTYVEVCAFLIKCYEKKLRLEHNTSLTIDAKVKRFTVDLEKEYDAYFKLEKKSSSKR